MYNKYRTYKIFLICLGIATMITIKSYDVYIPIISSIISSLIALEVIVINYKMIENTSRPYISIYLRETYYSKVEYNVLIKNFGNSSATITDIKYSDTLNEFMRIQGGDPLKNLKGTSLAPGQNLILLHQVGNEKIKELRPQKPEIVKITYKSSSGQDYTDSFTLRFSTFDELRFVRTQSSNEERRLERLHLLIRDYIDKQL